MSDSESHVELESDEEPSDHSPEPSVDQDPFWRYNTARPPKHTETDMDQLVGHVAARNLEFTEATDRLDELYQRHGIIVTNCLDAYPDRTRVPGSDGSTAKQIATYVNNKVKSYRSNIEKIDKYRYRQFYPLYNDIQAQPKVDHFTKLVQTFNAFVRASLHDDEGPGRGPLARQMH